MIAALPMYDFPELRRQTDAYWAGLRGHLAAAGLTDLLSAGTVAQRLSALDAVVQVEPEIDAVSTMAFALAIGIYLLESAGEFSLAKSCLQRLHDIVEPVAELTTVDAQAVA